MMHIFFCKKTKRKLIAQHVESLFAQICSKIEEIMAKIDFEGLKEGHVFRCHGYYELKTKKQVFTITGVVHL